MYSYYDIQKKLIKTNDKMKELGFEVEPVTDMCVAANLYVIKNDITCPNPLHMKRNNAPFLNIGTFKTCNPETTGYVRFYCDSCDYEAKVKTEVLRKWMLHNSINYINKTK